MALETEGIHSIWILDTDGVKKPLDEVVKKFKEAEKVEKALDYANKQIAASMGKAGVSAQAMAHAIGDLAADAIRKLASGFGAAFHAAVEFEDLVGKNTASLKGLQTATAGLVPAVELARMRQRLMASDLGLTTSQMETVAKAAMQLSRITEQDLTSSMDQVTKAINSGSTRAIRDLGIQIDVTGTTSQKSAAILKELQTRFGGLTFEAENTEERIAQLKTTLTDTIGELGSAILRSETMTLTFEGLSSGAKMASILMRGFAGSLSPLSKEFRNVTLEGVRFMSLIPGMGRGFKELEKNLGKLSKLYSYYDSTQDAIAQAQSTASDAQSLGKKYSTESKSKKSGKATAEKTEKGVKGYDYTPNAEYSDETKEFLKTGQWKSLDKAQKDAVDSAMDYWDAQVAGSKSRVEAAKSTDKLIDKTTELNKYLEEQGSNLKQLEHGWKGFAYGLTQAAYEAGTMGVTALSNFAGGMWEVIDASIQGEESMAMGTAKAIKSILLSLAAEATVKGLMAIYEGIYPPNAALIAKGVGLLGVAALAGGIGIGVSYGIKGAGGYDKKEDKTSSSSSSSGSRPSFKTKSESTRPIYVLLQIDRGDPAATIFTSRKLKAQLAKS